jgi:hypothetical protein
MNMPPSKATSSYGDISAATPRAEKNVPFTKFYSMSARETDVKKLENKK